MNSVKKVLILGGGPGGLYSGILIKKAHPRWDVTVLERNPPDATYGWGVVFSDRTLTSFREADYRSFKDITDHFAIWDAIDVRFAGESIRCGGNIFAGIARKLLLDILQKRCEELNVRLEFLVEVTDLSGFEHFDLLVAADGINSIVRKTLADAFQPRLTWGSAKYIWLGTRKVFDAFTFSFRESEHGLLQAHIYPNDGTGSTVVVLCDQESWRQAGLDRATGAESVAYCERVFAEDLGGEHLLTNKSEWITFATVCNKRWRHRNIVLLGDAAHTADFTIGSGTKLAMEDAIALANALERHDDDLETGLNEYERERRPGVEALQKAALESAHYFENIKRYTHFEPMQFVFYLLTRSGRISYNELRRRDGPFVEAVDRWFFESTTAAPAHNVRAIAPPPMLAPFRLRQMRLANRVVLSCLPTDSARAGIADEATRAQFQTLASAGAALVLTEPVAVSAEGRVTSGCAGLYTEEHAALWSRLTQTVRDGDGSIRLGIRLGHAGRRGSARPRWGGLDRPLHEGSWPLLSASPIPYVPGGQVPKEMDRADMESVCEAFVRATRMADEAGFDLVQLFFAHGYLVASFISPLTNRRRDAYGGSLENRMRFPLEILDAVRAVWPAAKPLSVAISATDWQKGGSDLEEAVVVAGMLKEHGCDLVEVLAGQTTLEAEPVYGPYVLTSFSDRIRNEAHVPTLTGGYLTTTDEINTILAAGRGDLCILEPPQLNPRFRLIQPALAGRARCDEAAHHAARGDGQGLQWAEQR